MENQEVTEHSGACWPDSDLQVAAEHLRHANSDLARCHHTAAPRTRHSSDRAFIRCLSGPVVVLATVYLLLVTGCWGQVPVRFDVLDVSFLWPVPQTVADTTQLIGVDEVSSDGTPFWPQEAFDQVLTAAKTVQVATPGGLSRIVPDEGFMSRAVWKVAGVRVDPSAPGTSEAIVRTFGAMPQLRLIVQPVTPNGSGRVRVHDVAAHLVFNFGAVGEPLGPGLPPRGIPDKIRFREVVNDLLALKKIAEASGARTAGPLSVHPGFQVPAFRDAMRSFLKKHLAATRLQAVAFMGIDPPEPWIFFAMAKINGVFVRVGTPEMVTFRGFSGGHVLPTVAARTFGPGSGVATATLFGSAAAAQLDASALSNTTDEKLRELRNRDIPDIIANPQIAHFFNTDCVSCHTETTRRSVLRLAPGRMAFKLPEAVSGVDPAVVPTDGWNVHNFGWFPPNQATVTQRTANEAAEAADYINREYLDAEPSADSVDSSAPPSTHTNAIDQLIAPASPVQRPLTLVMTIKSRQDRAALEVLLKQFEALPSHQNPIKQAMRKLRNVHFARFAFLGEDKLAVITTYDGSLESYIDAFVNEIGAVFDQLLTHMQHAPPLPVAQHRQAFLHYVQRHDAAVGSFFSAYPALGVQDILLQEGQRSGLGPEPRN